MDIEQMNRVLKETYEPAIKAQIEAESPFLRMLAASTPKRSRWWRLMRRPRAIKRRLGEVWTVARHGADHYRSDW